MGCFIVPGGEAVITTVISKVVDKKTPAEDLKKVEGHINFKEKLSWLNKMLWGGSALLAFEHIWHGEITPFFPFITAMNDPSDAAELFHEMSTVGVGMAALVTLAWGGLVLASSAIEKKNRKAEDEV